MAGNRTVGRQRKYINDTVSVKHNKFYYYIWVFGNIFRLLSSHLQALQKLDTREGELKMHWGSHSAFLAHFILDLILEGPEDDSIGVEICCPRNSNIIINFVVFDCYSVIYINMKTLRDG